MKILILSCNTGGGHNTAAKALKEVFDAKDDECIIKDALSFGSQQYSDFVCDSYIEMVKKTPRMFGELYKIGENWYQYKSEKSKLKTPVYIVNGLYADKLGDYCIEEKIDAIVCTHIFPAQSLTHVKHHRDFNIPVYYISTDYSCIPMLEESECDIIFSPHKDTLETYTIRGIDEKTVIPAGIPVAQKFTQATDKAGARKELGLNENDRIILLMSGSMGFGDTLDTAREIFKRSEEDTKLIVITGSNKEMYKKFEKEFRDNTRLILVGFTDQVSLYMDACDILLSKPGGLSSTEAIVKHIPLIHTSPIPGCETENADFFQKHHLSLVARTSIEAASEAILLLNDHFLRNQMTEAQKHYSFPNTAMFIADFIKEAYEKKN